MHIDPSDTYKHKLYKTVKNKRLCTKAQVLNRSMVTQEVAIAMVSLVMCKAVQ